MYHEVSWNDDLLNDFIKEAKLSSKEISLLKARVLNESSLQEQADILNVSKRTIQRRMDEIKVKYDVLSASNPKRFPPRNIKIDYPAVLYKYSGKILFTVDGKEDDIHVIEMDGKEFSSSKNMMNHIYSEVCSTVNKSLAEINEIRFLNNINYTVKFKKD